MNATTRTRSRIVRSLAAAGLVTALATGCSVGLGEPDDGAAGGTAAEQDDGAADDGTSADGASGASDAGGAEGSDSEDAVIDEDTVAAGVDITQLGEPVATAEIPAVVEGDPDATMTVELFGLEKRGEVVTGTFAFTVDSDATPERPQWLYGYLGAQGWTPYAIDTVNLNKHGVLGGINGAVTNHQGGRFMPGETFYAYASFSAPPADVTTMDVMMVEGAPLATGVEIR